MIDPYDQGVLWLVVVGFMIAFVLAFGIGANDVANSFGTSVGSHALTIYQACCLATIFEIAGAILIGYKVSDTMRKGILQVDMYDGFEKELMLGCVSALLASAIWLLVATFLKMPISGTHSIVGATVGFSLAARGTQGIQWMPLITIVVSWFVSPLLSGLMSMGIHFLIHRIIMMSPTPLKIGLRCMPIIYGFTAIVNVFSIMHDGPKLLYMDKIPTWLAATISFGTGIIVILIVWLVIVPRQRRKIKRNLNMDQPNVTFALGASPDQTPRTSPTRNPNRLSQVSDDRPLNTIAETAEMVPLTNKTASKGSNYKRDGAVTTPLDLMNHQDPSANQLASGLRIVDSTATINPLITPNTSTIVLYPVTQYVSPKLDAPNSNSGEAAPENASLRPEAVEVSKLFAFLQILTAIFGSFAHGGNDVSNAIGPLITLWLIYTEGSVQQKAETPVYILLYGGLGISIGLWLMGRRVIETIGKDLTKITPTTGFAIELGAAFTVLLASKIGLPISTTHCKVGSVVFVGLADSTSAGVDWNLFWHIISAWLITVPLAGLLSAACMTALRYTVL